MRGEKRPAWADGWRHPMDRPPAVIVDEDDQEEFTMRNTQDLMGYGQERDDEPPPRQLTAYEEAWIYGDDGGCPFDPDPPSDPGPPQTPPPADAGGGVVLADDEQE